ncbi:MAG: DNA mismatch repair endonuclease MutL, partial [Cyclobacteriaceae bacterium]
MPDIIHLLPDSIANQIAAGEVVQRPSSAVKEMLENSVDAGSTSIKLIIKDAGKSWIQVIDNGKGMSETDARMCFERHATSKIKETKDLFDIHTYGFRGEAMASIAAIAQVELKTKKETDELGSCIKIEGSSLIAQEEVSCTTGTSITVKNLFFNVPARRNFLKSNPVETRHIVDEFQRVALAYPHISFQLFQNDLETYHLPAGKLSTRIVGLFGKNYQSQLASCEEEVQDISIKGYIGKPECAKKTRGEQFFFANNRFIKHHYLNHAVQEAYEGTLPKDTYPFHVLFIELPPKMIDINVHPTKTEVKFEDERMIYGIVKAAVKKALGSHNLTPSIDFDRPADFAFSGTSFGDRKSTIESTGSSSFASFFKKEEPTPLQQSNHDNWEEMYKGFDNPLAKTNTSDQGELTFSSSINTDCKTPLSKQSSYFQLHSKYIVSQVKSGLMLINQQAAHERILYEKYMDALQNKTNASQQCLFPPTLTLNPADYSLAIELQEEVKKLGFIIDPFGANTIIINGIPQQLIGGEEKKVFEELIEQFKSNKDQLKLTTQENLARSLALKTAKKEG